MSDAACGKSFSGWCSSRLCPAVVPITSEQSATACATLLYCSALWSRGAAPTAERASRKEASYGFTTRSRRNPRLLMARAAAPILSGLRVETSTTQRRPNSVGMSKIVYSKAPQISRAKNTQKQGEGGDQDGKTQSKKIVCFGP